MYYLRNIKQARKDRKLSADDVKGAINGARQRIERYETGTGELNIGQLEDYGRRLELNICLLTDAECEILAQLSLFCGKIGVKEGRKGE